MVAPIKAAKKESHFTNRMFVLSLVFWEARTPARRLAGARLADLLNYL